jgi:hypothetical protein
LIGEDRIGGGRRRGGRGKRRRHGRKQKLKMNIKKIKKIKKRYLGGSNFCSDKPTYDCGSHGMTV